MKKQGIFACQQFNEKYHEDYKLLRHSPTGKDFNEDLLTIKSNLQESRAREPEVIYGTERDIEKQISGELDEEMEIEFS